MTTPADPAVDAVWCGICCCWIKLDDSTCALDHFLERHLPYLVRNRDRLKAKVR